MTAAVLLSAAGPRLLEVPAFKPAYLIHGDDHGRIGERRSRLRALAEAESGAQGVEVFEGENSTPEAVLGARLDVVDASWQRLLGEAVLKSDEMAEAAALARDACGAITTQIEGRPLYAAHASLPWPEPEHLQLWHATTLLREHRGDGHIAALVLSGLNGLEVSVNYVTYRGAQNEELQRSTRGYSEDEWAQGKADLRAKGIFDADNAYTEFGRAQREAIEAQTDEAAKAPYEHLGTERTARLIELVRPWARSITKQIFG